MKNEFDQALRSKNMTLKTCSRLSELNLMRSKNLEMKDESEEFGRMLDVLYSLLREKDRRAIDLKAAKTAKELAEADSALEKALDACGGKEAAMLFHEYAVIHASAETEAFKKAASKLLYDKIAHSVVKKSEKGKEKLA